MRIKEVILQGWEIDSSIPGKSVAIIGGVHGDELLGIRVVQKLLEYFRTGQLKVSAGRLLLILGNPSAIERGSRFDSNAIDLNRLFSQYKLDCTPNCVGLARAHELARILRDVEVVLDLHATHMETAEPFIMMQPHPNPKTLELTQAFGTTKLITDPHFTFGGGQPVSLDEYVSALGNIGICYETGLVSDLSRVDTVTQEATQLLQCVGVVEGTPAQCTSSPSLYEITEVILLGLEGFRWHNGVGYVNLHQFHSGEIVGWRGDQSIAVKEDSITVFPKVPEFWEVGKPVCYLAKKL